LQRPFHELDLQPLIMFAADAVPRVRVQHHLEIAVGLLRRIHQLHGVLDVDVVVHHLAAGTAWIEAENDVLQRRHGLVTQTDQASSGGSSRASWIFSD
jgi:hypothetical protein